MLDDVKRHPSGSGWT